MDEEVCDGGVRPAGESGRRRRFERWVIERKRESVEVHK